MKHILSFVLISALVFAAASSEVQDFSDFLDAFSGKINVTDPSLGKCPEALVNAFDAFETAVDLISDMDDGDAIEQAVGNFAFKLTHSIRVCANVGKSFSGLINAVGSDIIELDFSAASSRIFANLATFQMKFMQAKNASAHGDFKTLGSIIGDVYMVIFHGDNFSRSVRQLSVFSHYVKKVDTSFNSTYLGFLGFLEEANTTVAVSDYVTFANDTSAIVAMTATLEDAIQKMDFATIIATVQALKDKFTVLTNSFKVLDAELLQFVERDLPLFDTAEQVQKISQYMFANLPTTMVNMQRIMNAYKSADFRELGHGTGALYNQLRAGAMSSF